MGCNPLVGFFKTLYLFVTRHVNFIHSSKGRTVVMEDGEVFTVFRHVKVDCIKKDLKEPEALFEIRFKLKNMSIKKNKTFSLLPMMIFMGFKGFRSKYWMLNPETGYWQGLYEWQTLEDAINYSKSFAVKFMTKRSVPGSVYFEVVDKYPALNTA